MRNRHEREILALFFSKIDRRGASPAIFLDRDGVINRRIEDGYVTKWSEFKFIPGIRGAISELSALKLPIIVVSNQAGVGKGLLPGSRLVSITKRFVTVLRRAGARIDAVYYCPHMASQKCSCRKPKAGLLRRAAADWGLELKKSILVGDSPSDARAAKAAGCRSVLTDARLPASAKSQARRGSGRANAPVTPAEMAKVVRELVRGRTGR